jgi:hypothetical protein
VGANISAANATGKAKYAAAIGPTVTPPPTTIAAVAIQKHNEPLIYKQ